jgi:hypothetical protein
MGSRDAAYVTCFINMGHTHICQSYAHNAKALVHCLDLYDVTFDQYAQHNQPPMHTALRQDYMYMYIHPLAVSMSQVH